MTPTLYISPDYTCNERCVFCPCSQNSHSYTALTLDELCESVDLAIQERKIEMVLISGGEPTMYRDLIPFLRHVRSRQIRFGLLSNSIKFASSSYLDRFLREVGSDFELTTAFHSCIPEEHDRITGLPNSFQRSLQGVQNLWKAGVHVTVKYNINNLTYKQLPEFAQWIYNTFPDSISWVLCNIDVCGHAETNKECTAVSFDQSRTFLETVLDYVISQAENGRRRVVQVYNTPLCCVDPYYWPFLQKNEGGVMSAFRIPYQSVSENRLLLDAQGDGGAVFEPCQSCALQNYCPGTWYKTGEMFSDRCFHPFQAEEDHD